MPTLFRGATTVRSAIASFLETKLPVYIDQARAQWALQDWQLPYVQVVREYERPLVSPYPSVDISVSLIDQITFADHDEVMAEQWRSRYNIAIVNVVKTPYDADGKLVLIQNDVENPEDASAYAATMKLRDDMEAVVRNTLLQNQTMMQPDALQLDPATMTVSFSDAQKVGRGLDYAAAVAFNFRLWVDEDSLRDAVGTADTINTNIEPMQ